VRAGHGLGETIVVAILPGPVKQLSELARKFHDNAVRSLPQERAPRSRPERSPFLTLRASRISPRCWPRQGSA